MIEAGIEQVTLVEDVLHDGRRRMPSSLMKSFGPVLREKMNGLVVVGESVLVNAETLLVHVVQMSGVGVTRCDLGELISVAVHGARKGVHAVAGVKVVLVGRVTK